MKHHIAALVVILSGCAADQSHPRFNTNADIRIQPVSEVEMKVSATLQQETASEGENTSSTLNFPETSMLRATGGYIRVKNKQTNTGVELTVTPENSAQGTGYKIHLKSISIPQASNAG